MIVAMLVLIAGGIFYKQYSFNPAVLANRQAAQLVKPASASPVGSVTLSGIILPANLVELGKPEAFTPDNLYDKIDGKAELYLAAGFVGMNCRRFALKQNQDVWVEWSVYDMGELAHAFSVFSVQRRAEGQPAALGEYAYRTQNAVFFVCGKNYIEAVASEPNELLLEGVIAFARSFIAFNPAPVSKLAELDLLPGENLVPGSQTLQIADAFGFDQLTNVFTATYQIGSVRATGFVEACADNDAAHSLAQAYFAFLKSNGGKALAGATPDAAVEMMGSIELVFSEGRFLAGVHTAPSLAVAKKLADTLRASLAKSTMTPSAAAKRSEGQP